MDITEAARMIAAQRKLETRTCAICGKQVEATNRRKYCSAACSQMAHRRRAKATPTPASAPAEKVIAEAKGVAIS